MLKKKQIVEFVTRFLEEQDNFGNSILEVIAGMPIPVKYKKYRSSYEY